MKVLTWGIVGAGLLLALVLGLHHGLDATGLTILGFIIVTGGVALAAVQRSERGTIGPTHCSSCDGVISPNAPYCKHCGVPRS